MNLNRFEREAQNIIARLDAQEAPDVVYPGVSKQAARLVGKHYERVVKSAHVDLLKAEQAIKEQTYESLVGAGRTPATALEAKYMWLKKFIHRYTHDGKDKDTADFSVVIQSFEGAEVYTVAPHIHSMLDHAAEILPLESSLSETDIPAGSGMIFGSRRFLDKYDALGWINISIAERNVNGYLLCIFGYMEFEVRDFDSFIFPLVSVYYDKPLSYTDERTYSEGYLELDDALNLRKFIASFLYFVNQRVLTTSSERADRATRKRLAKEGKNSEQVIKVIQLRASSQSAAAPSGHHTEWSTRWIVRGHWRNQPYGPSRSLVKPIWISPYVKGPEDKPVKVNTHLFEVSR